MRHCYLAYRENQFLAPLVREIGWSHNIIIFEKCKDELQREFYLRMTKKHGGGICFEKYRASHWYCNLYDYKNAASEVCWVIANC